jgi:hypothetical protein
MLANQFVDEVAFALLVAALVLYMIGITESAARILRRERPQPSTVRAQACPACRPRRTGKAGRHQLRLGSVFSSTVLASIQVVSSQPSSARSSTTGHDEVGRPDLVRLGARPPQPFEPPIILGTRTRRERSSVLNQDRSERRHRRYNRRHVRSARINRCRKTRERSFGALEFLVE